MGFLDDVTTEVRPLDSETCELSRIALRLAPPLPMLPKDPEEDDDDYEHEVTCHQSASFRVATSSRNDSYALEWFYSPAAKKRERFACPKCEVSLLKAIRKAFASDDPDVQLPDEHGSLVLERLHSADCVMGRCLRGCSSNDLGSALSRLVELIEQKARDGIKAAELSRYSLKQLATVGTIAWLVHEIIPERGLTMLIGDGGSRKTFTTIAMGLSIAAGIPIFGVATKRARVFLILLEGSREGQKRVLVELARGLEIDLEQLERDQWLFIAPEDYVLKLDDPTSAQQLDRAIELFDPGVIAIDNLTKARAVSPGSENDAGAMTLAMAKLESLARHRSILLLHHVSQDGTARGSTAIKDNSDRMLKLVAADADEAIVTMTRGKGRDGGLAEPIRYRFRGHGPIELEMVGKTHPKVEADPLHEKILGLLTTPMAKDEVYRTVGGRRALATKAFEALIERGDVIDAGDGKWQRAQ